MNLSHINSLAYWQYMVHHVQYINGACLASNYHFAAVVPIPYFMLLSVIKTVKEPIHTYEVAFA